MGKHIISLAHTSSLVPLKAVIFSSAFHLFSASGCTSSHQSVKLTTFTDGTNPIGEINHLVTRSSLNDGDTVISALSRDSIDANM